MMRVGIGYDVHRFEAGRFLRLGGVDIPFRRKLVGHSDADVLLHAVTDALYGAVAAGDIGAQFPSSNARYRRADSRLFVQAAHQSIRRRGWVVQNMDAVLITDAPKLLDYRDLIRRSVGRLLKTSPERISIKAKTTEGFPPGDKGIAAYAVVLLTRMRRKRISRRKP